MTATALQQCLHVRTLSKCTESAQTSPHPAAPDEAHIRGKVQPPKSASRRGRAPLVMSEMRHGKREVMYPSCLAPEYGVCRPYKRKMTSIGCAGEAL